LYNANSRDDQTPGYKSQVVLVKNSYVENERTHMVSGFQERRGQEIGPPLPIHLFKERGFSDRQNLEVH